MIRKFGGAAGIDGQPQGLDIGVGGGSNIKSIQTLFAYDYSAAGSFVNYTINAVDVSKSIVLIDIKMGQGSYGDTPDRTLATVKITSPTNVLMQVGGTGISHSHVITVIEFKEVKSKQSGTTMAYEGVTISAVNLSKSLLFYSYRRTILSTPQMYYMALGKFNSSTYLQFFGENSSDMTIEWQVIEFN